MAKGLEEIGLGSCLQITLWKTYVDGYFRMDTGECLAKGIYCRGFLFIRLRHFDASLILSLIKESCSLWLYNLSMALPLSFWDCILLDFRELVFHWSIPNFNPGKDSYYWDFQIFWCFHHWHISCFFIKKKKLSPASEGGFSGHNLSIQIDLLPWISRNFSQNLPRKF